MMTSTDMAVLIWCLVFLFQWNVHAGPVAARPQRIAREVYPEIEPTDGDANHSSQVCIVGDVVYEIDEPVPADQPCLKCRCQPPGVQCETIRCAKKPGCKAIHRPNKCCPDYQCECEHEGKMYANGERLETPPGGECKVCYCRGGEVQCAKVSCYIRTDCEAKTVPGQCCPKFDNCPPKEPLLGRPYTTGPPLPEVNRETLEVWPLTKLVENATQEENLLSKQGEQKITIHEIIPEIKEIAITAESLDSTINDVVVTDAEPDSSEISEVFQQPPPVLRIGDKLLFLKQGELIAEKDASTPSTVITLIGAEGLQRGFEDNSAESHEGRPLFTDQSNDLEPKTSESTHILSLVKRKTTVAPPTTTVINPVDVTPTSTNLVEETSTMFDQTNVTDSIQMQTNEIVATTEITTQSSTEIPHTIDLVEENPAYPPLPDDMADGDRHLVKVEGSDSDQKILPEVLPIRNNHTIGQNVTYSEWLKNGTAGDNLVNVRAAIPDEILKQKASSDEEITTGTTPSDDVTTATVATSDLELRTTPITTEFEQDNVTTADSDITTATDSTTTDIASTQRSVESLEDTNQDSGEFTTPRNNHASIVSEENASVEQSSDHNLEAIDMLSTTNIDNVEFINTEGQTQSTQSTPNSTPIDVELITNTTESDTVRNLKLELRPKIIGKRESSPEDEGDEVFKELNDEINEDLTSHTLSEDEDQEQSDRIFRELLEETSTPKSQRPVPQTKDQETLQRVSEVIARVTLGKTGTGDGNILGLLSDFFGYDKRGK